MWEAPQKTGRGDPGLLTLQETRTQQGRAERSTDYHSGMLLSGPGPPYITKLGALQGYKRSKKGIRYIKKVFVGKLLFSKECLG